MLAAGLSLLLEHGYNDLGIQALLDATGTPKGSFYHHFGDKEDFALQVIDRYMDEVHAGLDHCLEDLSRPPLERVRDFFRMTGQSYQQQGYRGCLLGSLGQELCAVNERFRQRIDECLALIGERLAVCLHEAQQRGELRPDPDSRHLATLLVDCWEGAALRSRIRGSAAPLDAMLDFYFEATARRA